MNTSRIAFIGAGNMAKAIIGGLLAQGFSPAQVSAAGPRMETLQKVADEFGISVSTDNAATAAAADVVVLGVKPQMLKEVGLGLREALAHIADDGFIVGKPQLIRIETF